MSGGMEDASATGRLAERLEEAAYVLRDRIRAAEEGHRGYAISVVAHVSGILREVGYEIVRVSR